jgi:hypothetical protein
MVIQRLTDRLQQVIGVIILGEDVNKLLFDSSPLPNCHVLPLFNSSAAL